MRHLLRSMTLAAVAAAFVTIGGCAPKPIGLGPVDTGAGTLAAALKYLEGRWGLLSFEVHPPGRDVIHSAASEVRQHHL
jgi:biotin transporter BioY